MTRARMAMAMIWLIVSIPFYSAGVLASIVSVGAHGKDGINGILSYNNDYVEINASLDEAALPGDLQTDYPQQSYFSTCQQEGSGYVCTYRSDRNDWNPGKYGYTVTLFDDGVTKSTMSGSYYVDGLAPEIDSFDLSYGHEMVNISYSVKDRACDSCGSICSGIMRLSILEDQVIKKTVELGTGSCSSSGILQLPVSDLSTIDGETKICLRATDMLDQQSEPVCKKLLVDSSSPVISSSSFRLLDEDGYGISYVPSLPLAAVAVINVSDSSLDSVYGDFSGLNTVAPDRYSNVKAQCSSIGDNLYSCRWPNLLVDSASGSVSVKINATDTEGNSASSEITLDLIAATGKPVISRVYTNPDSEVLALKAGINRITVELSGNGAGYNKKQVYLDLSSMGGAAKIEPDSCHMQGDAWLCRFTSSISGVDGSTGYVYVTAKDDAGNAMETSYNAKAVIDSVKPVTGDVELSSECAYAGQGLDISVHVTDRSAVTMAVDAGDISTAGRPFQGVCTEDGENSFDCSVTITHLITAHAEGTAMINITDAAGNIAVINEHVEVCEEEGTTTPNFVKVSVGSPNPVDKRLLSFLSTEAYVPLTLKTTGGAKIIEKYVSCTGSDSSYLLNSETITPMLVARLKKGSASPESSTVELSCRLSMIIKRGTRVYSTPEEEDLNISIPLYNNALGEISDSMQTKIKEVQGQIDDLQDDIDKWENWNRWLGMLCSIAEMMASLNSIAQSILQVHWAWACPAYVECKAAQPECNPTPISAFWQSVCSYATKFDNMVQAYFWPTDLTGPPPHIGAVIKYGCLLYSCRLCDANFYVSVGLLAASAAWGSRSVEKTPTETAYQDALWTYPDQETPAYEVGESDESQSFWDAWKENGINTRIKSEIDTSSWEFNPYRSIHYAKSCMCLPGYIYNLKKDRQIKCMYKTCLSENAKVGLPTDSCDAAYKERECLYVDSAQYKLHGYMGGVLDSLTKALLSNLPSILLGIAHRLSCGKNTGCSTNPCSGYKRVVCGITSAAIMITQIKDFLNGGLDFSKYEADLDGKDYCTGGDGS